jgi:hypothetical protein
VLRVIAPPQTKAEPFLTLLSESASPGNKTHWELVNLTNNSENITTTYCYNVVSTILKIEAIVNKKLGKYTENSDGSEYTPYLVDMLCATSISRFRQSSVQVLPETC